MFPCPRRGAFGSAGGTAAARPRAPIQRRRIRDYGRFRPSRPANAAWLPGLTNLALIYEAPRRNWSLPAYLRNLENKAQLTYSLAPTPDDIVAVLSDPRTYGISASLKF
jgi:outer membrane receptor protein involved in Fe transport